jgi:hypothetical protein
MVDPELKRELKSSADFEQWLGEIKLFAQATLRELHEVAGLLTKSLAQDCEYSASQSQQAQPSELETGRENAMNSRQLENDPLSAIQSKIAKQLNAHQAADANAFYPPPNVDAVGSTQSPKSF